MKNFACPYTGSSYVLHPYQEYEYITTLPQEQAQALLDVILQKTYTANKVYNDDKTCFVASINTDAHSNIILKFPRERNNRPWERFLTLFRPNEAFRTFSSMMVVQSIGLKCPQPLIAVHKKEKGMSVESFFVYDFIEGAPGVKENAPVIYKELKILHSAGYTRSDPKLVNFIVNKDEVYFIDFRLKKPKFFTKFQCTLNLCRFLHLAVSRDLKQLDDYVQDNSLLGLAHYLLMMKKRVRKFRRGLRDIISQKKK